MKILFAPSEAKNSGGEGKFELKKLCCPQINKLREKLIKEYEKIILSDDIEVKKALTGLKKESDLNEFGLLLNAPVMKAIKRYSGVAYEYLGYEKLPKTVQNYIDKNVIIFSNLFGVLLASDKIPLYKVKQGAQIGAFKVETLYSQALKKPLDEFVGEEEILDLSPTFYKKFFKLNAKVMQLKFLKNNKIVSHWAKAYRGIVLKEIAKNNVQSFDEFLQLQIPNLAIKEIKEGKKKIEVIFEII